MLGHRDLTMQDYTGILKRRFWLILISAIVFLGVGVGLTYVIPPHYMSKTLVLIERQKVPENYVNARRHRRSGFAPGIDEGTDPKPLTPSADHREIQLVCRPRKYHGRPHRNDAEGHRDRSHPPTSTTPYGTPGFFITFKAQDARTAQQVCGEITSLFVSENLNAREQSAEGTTDFLKQQLADAKAKLDDQDAKLAAFEQKNFGALPDEEQGNMNTLQSLTSQLDAATQQLSRTQQEVTFLEALVAQQTQDSQSTESGSSPASVDARKTELQDLIKQKQALETAVHARLSGCGRDHAKDCRFAGRDRARLG